MDKKILAVTLKIIDRARDGMDSSRDRYSEVSRCWAPDRYGERGVKHAFHALTCLMYPTCVSKLFVMGLILEVGAQP